MIIGVANRHDLELSISHMYPLFCFRLRINFLHAFSESLPNREPQHEQAAQLETNSEVNVSKKVVSQADNLEPICGDRDRYPTG